MKIKELRALAKTELQAKENSLQEELFKLNKERFSGRVEKPHRFSQVKRDIARVKTLLNEKREEQKNA
jgi:large subunit ribosomal protein L29